MIEPSVVLWATFFGAAVANALRLIGVRFHLEALIAILLLTLGINFVAMVAKLMRSRPAFYARVFGAFLGCLVTSVEVVDIEHVLRGAAYERDLLRRTVITGVATCLSGLAAAGLGWASAYHRK